MTTDPLNRTHAKINCSIREDRQHELTGQCHSGSLVVPLSGNVGSSGDIRFQMKTGPHQEGTVTFAGILDRRKVTVGGTYHLRDAHAERDGEFVALRSR